MQQLHFGFFGFFRSKEITVLSLTSFDASRHLVWRDIALDSINNLQSLKIYLKKRRGVNVYVGKTDCPLCPLTTVVHYMALQGVQGLVHLLFSRMVPH